VFPQPRNPFETCSGATKALGRPHGRQDGGMSLAETALAKQIAYADWTDVNHLRHSKFIAPRHDKRAQDSTKPHV
jgi:hypothetical protein